MKHGSLFSGIGGFDLAAQWMGWENVFHCEWNPFGQRVLKHYWPNADSHHDITKTNFEQYANRIDILTGGFPCQPYSSAGKRKGKEDERHLWPEMLRTIREVAPRYVVGENVLGLTNWKGELYSTRCILIWNLRVTKSRPWLYLRRRSMRPTDASAFGLSRGAMLPTPTASSSNGGTDKERTGKISRKTELNHLMSQQNGKPSQLNPQFVAEMMGFPTNWTESPFQSGDTNH